MNGSYTRNGNLMLHLFKWPNKFADVFFISINDTIEYEVRDKESGKLVEPKKQAKYVVSGAMVYFDHREIPLELFNHIALVLG